MAQLNAGDSKSFIKIDGVLHPIGVDILLMSAPKKETRQEAVTLQDQDTNSVWVVFDPAKKNQS